MRVIAVAIRYLAGAEDQDIRQILLSADVHRATTYRQVYAQLSEGWQEEGQSPINSRTTNAEMDAMFEQELTALRRRDAALLGRPFHECMGPGWEQSRIAFFSVTWITDEDG